MRVRARTALQVIYAIGLAALAASQGCANDGTGSLYDTEQPVSGERALVQLPCEFQVKEENRLYVYGERMRSVSLEVGPGDTLFLNGVPILPKRTPPPPAQTKPRPSDDPYAKLYGNVPFVVERVASGSTAAEAGRAYLRVQEQLRQRIYDTYFDGRSEGLAPVAAAERAFARLVELDTDELIDWTRSCEVRETDIRLFWKGWEWSSATLLLRDWPEEYRSSDHSEGKAQLLATQLYEFVALGEGPCWFLIGATGRTLMCGEDRVSAALDQLAHARRTGEYGVSPLNSRQVQLILAGEEE